MVVERIRCPYVDAKGRRCTGHVCRTTLFGRFGRARRLRLVCDRKYDHRGFMTGRWGKEPMQFFLDDLPDDIRVPVLSLFEVGRTNMRLKTKEKS